MGPNIISRSVPLFGRRPLAPLAVRELAAVGRIHVRPAVFVRLGVTYVTAPGLRPLRRARGRGETTRRARSAWTGLR